VIRSRGPARALPPVRRTLTDAAHVSPRKFFHAHSIATDPRVTLLVGESQGYRVQRFLYKGLANGQKSPDLV
jgi:hypothetical protein